MNTSTKKNLLRTKSFRRTVSAGLGVVLSLSAMHFSLADYVGESQTTIYMDQATQNQIAANYLAGKPGFNVGDVLNYITQFTPVPGTATEYVGATAVVTDYIPAGLEVVGAYFVQVSGNTYTTINPPAPPAVTSIYLPEYSETGIFYSTDPRTQFYTTGGATAATQINGLQTIAGGPTMAGALIGATITPGATANYSVHNQWDYAQVLTGGVNTTNAAAVAGCTAPAANPASAVPSPVAGPDAFVKNDNTGGVGPWHRIAYPGSMYGTNTGVNGPGIPATTPGCIGGTPTSAGWPLSTTTPLPSNTNALRFIGGQTTVGQTFAALIQLRVTSAYVPGSTIINNSEVFGGDVSILNTGAMANKSPIWKYLFPSVANSSSSMLVVKQVTGMCVGASCVPQAFTGSTVPSQANLKVQYTATYLNSSGGPQTNVVLSDTMPAGASLVATSSVVVAGPNILPTSSAVGQAFTFAPLASLGSGAGGSVSYILNWLTAPAANVPLTNIIKMTSTSVASGVTSSATVTPTTLASLNISKTTTTPTISPGMAASYVISIPNNGMAAASLVNVVDTLPSNGLGTAVYNRFSYILNSVVATITSALGVKTTVTPISAVVAAPTLAPFRETVTFTFPASTVIPSGGTMTLNLGALVGSGVPATTTAYTNDASVAFLGGTTTAANSSVMAIAGQAPVTVLDPMTLTKSIDCVYVGATCMPYTAGSFVGSASKIKYRLTYVNTGSAAIAGVVLKDILPASTVYVAGTAAEVTGAGFTTFGTLTPATAASQVVTFGTGIASLPVSAVGAVTFDVQLPAASSVPSGSYITNNATMSSTLYPGGVTASVTTSVLDQPLLSITKGLANPITGLLAVGGTATYTITVSNIGSVAASGIKVYDALPFVSGVANAVTRFNYVSSVTVLPPAPSTLTAPTVASSVGAANSISAVPYTINANQQQVSWTFPASGVLAPGQSVVINMNAAAGSGITASPTFYYNSAQVFYGAGAVSGINASTNNVAGVQIPTGLSILKSIACVYSGTTCFPYNGTGIIPANATVRYQINYANTSTVAQSAVYVCDQLVSSSASAVTVTVTTPVSGVTNTAAPNGPPAGAVTKPASSVCGFSGVSAVAFNYPVIPTLAASSAGVVYVDMAMSGVVNSSSLTNTAKIVSAQAPSGEFSSVTTTALNVPSLSINKTTTTGMIPASGVASYTITVTNSGSAPTTSLQLYDWLPFNGTALDASKRFNYVATSSVVMTNASGVATTLPVSAVAVSAVVAPTVSPYSANPNQQQVLWNLGATAGNQLQPGSTLTINFSAAAGINLPVGNYGNSVGFAFGSVGGSGSNNVNNLALVTLATPPNITFKKTVIPYWDPINLFGNASAVPATTPLYLPGGLEQYTITASNAGGVTDNNSVFVTDVVPANMVLVISDIAGIGSGPILFNANTSGLTYTLATDITYSNTSPVWTPYTATPSPCSSLAGTMCDPNIRQFKINPKGVFNGSLTGTPPSFTYNYRMSLN